MAAKTSNKFHDFPLSQWQRLQSPNSKVHPCLEDIDEEIKQDFPTMSLATVYRNIVLIKSLGEVLKLGFPDGSKRYDGNKPYPHPHVISIKWKKIVDPELDSLDDKKMRLPMRLILRF